MWIESHQEIAAHPKLKRLARKLGVSKQAAIGYLHLLWWWALDYAPKGQIIPPYNESDIADAVEWDGDTSALVSAFLDAGFLEQINEMLVIHDWQDYAGKLLEKRENDRIRKEKRRRADRARAEQGK